MSDFSTHRIDCGWELPTAYWGLVSHCADCVKKFKAAVRSIPETNDAPTCRHGRTLLIPCSACEQFEKQ
jgi:hypothetical protein